jgi:hypothetical protein
MTGPTAGAHPRLPLPLVEARRGVESGVQGSGPAAQGVGVDRVAGKDE